MKYVRYIVWVTPLVLLLLFLRPDSVQESSPNFQTERKLASAPGVKKKSRTSHSLQPRAIRALRGQQSIDKLLYDRVPQSVENRFQRDRSVRISRGHTLVTDVVAVSKEKYTPQLGEVVYRDELFVYFRTSNPESFIPVALKHSTHRLYPIASVLHVKDASETVRDQLMREGHQQYYYNSSLKFLSLDSDGENILSLYRELLEKGYKVELEVLKPMPGPL